MINSIRNFELSLELESTNFTSNFRVMELVEKKFEEKPRSNFNET